MSGSDTLPPIVIDLGKKKKKQIKRLKKGRGRAFNEISEVVDDVRARLGAEAEGKILVPVVVVYKKKAKRGGGGLRLPFAL